MRHALRFASVFLVLGAGCLGDDTYGNGLGPGRGFYHSKDAGQEDAGREDDAGSPPVADLPLKLHLNAPASNEVVSGVIAIRGTTTGPADEVTLSVDGMLMEIAPGKPFFEIPFDTARVLNGARTFVVTASSKSGESVRASVGVIVDNISPIVGRWRVVGSTCEIYFFASGTVANACNALNGATIWRQETPSLITVINVSGSTFVFGAKVSADGKQLELTVGSTKVKLDRIQRLDPLDPNDPLLEDAGSP